MLKGRLDLTITEHVFSMRSMRSSRELNSIKDDSSDRELRLLSAIERDPEASQRSFSRRLGIALGLTNLLLHNLAGKGYVRITRAGWKRWLYNLTPAGVSRKVLLTIAYVHRFLDDYHRVRQMVRLELEPLGLNEESRIAVYGTGEFAELVYLALRETGIEELDVFGQSPSSNGKFLGMFVQDISTLRPEEYDRVVLADLRDSKSSLTTLHDLRVAPEKVITFFGAGEVSEEG